MSRSGLGRANAHPQCCAAVMKKEGNPPGKQPSTLLILKTAVYPRITTSDRPDGSDEWSSVPWTATTPNLQTSFRKLLSFNSKPKPDVVGPSPEEVEAAHLE